VREAAHGDRVMPGLALIAPGNRHLVIKRRGHDLIAELNDEPSVSGHRPSVDVLFRSVAGAGVHTTAALLTGMGSDGAEGLLALRKSGAMTIAQDEATCVVFGMPNVAIQCGAVASVLPLQRIAEGLLTSPRGHSR
jgi:two-component system, chemotaxis family, protein-glutamate methylesterase/glutaminase